MDTKKLRQKILDLAIRGKLVPQDPNDEPASVLLERIRAEKQQLIKEGKIKASKGSKACDTSHYEKIEGPFEIPESWEWVRLGEIFEHNTGKALNRSDSSGQLLSYITTSNLYWDRFVLEDVREMYFENNEIAKCTAHKGDLLVCEGGDIGRAAIWPYDYDIRIQNHIHKLRGYLPLNNRFFLHILRLYKMLGMIGGKGIGLLGLSSGELDKMPIPLPPINEQEKIVSQTDLCLSLVDDIDRYGVNLISLSENTKAKILNLAISGKLVPQDPTDEPAIELLKRINPDFRPCDNSHYPFEIPDNWSLSTFGQLNNHQSKTINPLSEPEKTFELYSVPIFETGKPEILKGIEIGSTKQLVHKGEVLVCKINPHLNRVWVVEHYNTQMDCIASSEWIVFQHPALLSKYALLYFQSPYFRERLMSNVSGVGGSLMRARPSAVDGYIVPIPPINEQRRIVQAVDKLLDNLSSIGNFL